MSPLRDQSLILPLSLSRTVLLKLCLVHEVLEYKTVLTMLWVEIWVQEPKSTPACRNQVEVYPTQATVYFFCPCRNVKWPMSCRKSLGAWKGSRTVFAKASKICKSACAQVRAKWLLCANPDAIQLLIQVPRAGVREKAVL